MPEFVQPKTGQIESSVSKESFDIIVQSETAQLEDAINTPMPKVLGLTTLTNHIEILCRCKSNEERLFYILYFNKDHLATRELKRCISNQTYSNILSEKTGLSKVLFETYTLTP